MSNKLPIKKVHIEFLRIFACFMVLYNHTDAAIRDVAFDDMSISRVASIVFFMLCKTAVPIFLLLSGANLKRKNDSVKKSAERIGKTILLIIVVSICYHLYYYRKLDFPVMVEGLISGKTTLAIWYLYLYLGILILLPILQKITFSKKMYLYIFILHLVGPGFIPFVEYYFNVRLLSSYILMPEVASYIIIFLMGDFLENELGEGKINAKHALTALVTGVCSMGITLGLAVYKMTINAEAFDDKMYNQIYYTPTILLACSIYVVCKYIFDKTGSNRWCSLISVIGSYTLGIYILGDFLRQELVFVLDFLKQRMAEFVSVLLYDLILLVAGILIMWLWNSLIKLFKVMVCNEKNV